jgi:hypothetical protein
MAMISSITEARSNRRERPIRSAPGVSGGHIFRSDLIPETGDAESDTPNCKPIEQQAHGILQSHFHIVDQFQIMVAGGGLLGKHQVWPYTVHFAAKHTGYGPITAGEQGLHYMVFRLGKDAGAGYLPEQRGDMKDLPRRHVMGPPVGCLTDTQRLALTGTVEHKAIALQADGLFATAYQTPAQQTIIGAAPSTGRGQFAYIAAGSVQFGGQTLEAGTAIFIAPSEPCMALTTGPLGAEILLMQFPHNSVQSVQ